MSKIDYRIAQPTDVEAILVYATQKSYNPNLSEIDNHINIWNTNFRREALEHYFKLGWSFIGFNEKNEVVGFFMGQPLLFFDKQTQTLWVEYIEANDVHIKSELVDIAYRLSREKHFQRVIYNDNLNFKELTKEFPVVSCERQNVYLKTTK